MNILAYAFCLTHTHTFLLGTYLGVGYGLHSWLFFSFNGGKAIFQSDWITLYFYQKLQEFYFLNILFSIYGDHILDTVIELVVNCYNNIVSFY